PQPGDVVVWKFGRTFSHGAVYVGDNKIIHSYIGRGVVLDELDQAELSGRPMKFFTFGARE
ncbi:NlpC/P60 family protein, partial [Neisseria sp. P0016.S002]